jgi:hypothetical protein
MGAIQPEGRQKVKGKRQKAKVEAEPLRSSIAASKVVAGSTFAFCLLPVPFCLAAKTLTEPFGSVVVLLRSAGPLRLSGGVLRSSDQSSKIGPIQRREPATAAGRELVRLDSR